MSADAAFPQDPCPSKPAHAPLLTSLKPSGSKTGSHPKVVGPRAGTMRPSVIPTKTLGSVPGPAWGGGKQSDIGFATAKHALWQFNTHPYHNKATQYRKRQLARRTIAKGKGTLGECRGVPKAHEHLVQPIVAQFLQKPLDIGPRKALVGVKAQARVLNKHCRDSEGGGTGKLSGTEATP